mmetsp:Transcript_27019/g.45940  ORF Transcript_27019/g.45940 Transcript_27019/m.45940 type:complete len:1169 (-) Transcript_27019:103-3609(-)
MSGSMEMKSEQRGLLSTAEEGAVGTGRSSSGSSYQSGESSNSSSRSTTNDDESPSDLVTHVSTRRYVSATIATLMVAWVAVMKITSSETMEATNDDEQSPFLLGITGLVPPYKSKGLPSSPSMNNFLDNDPAPFSLKSPAEIGIDDFIRSMDSRPGNVFGSLRREDAPSYEFNDPNFNVETVPKPAMPTNAWYQSLLVGSVNDGHLGIANRVYTIPYILDFVGPIQGVRIQFPHLEAGDTIVQLSTVARHGLTLGSNAVKDVYTVDEDSPPSQLGLGLKWTKSENHKMRTSIVRGIPYVTVEYDAKMSPTVIAEVPLSVTPAIDGVRLATDEYEPGCLGDDEANEDKVKQYRVEKEVSLSFKESDMTWLLFFSRPAIVEFLRDEAAETPKALPPGVVDFSTQAAFGLRVVDDDEPIIIRAALENNCTFGRNALFCEGRKPRGETKLASLLRKHNDCYPKNPSLLYNFPLDRDTKEVTDTFITFDWGATSMTGSNSTTDHDLLMYALPHHLDSMNYEVSSSKETGYCSEGIHGSSCLLAGNMWNLRESLGGPPSFVALRPPHHDLIPSLAKAVSEDIHFELPDNYMSGDGDTYFSGKQLAKLGRIIIIASELRGLAATPNTDSFDLDDSSERELLKIVQECKKADLPSDKDIAAAVARLRSGVEIWLNGTAPAKFTYDREWGGMVSCGCLFDDATRTCRNKFPDCPSYSDPGLNFGNGFYNDHHFHYGYLIYAAAVVSNYDYVWARKHFEEVLLLIRDIANPSTHDKFFPQFRQKDWFLGSSWASGIATLGGQPYPNGRNQESSSESIHGYEAIALYGSVCMHVWGDGTVDDPSVANNADVARRVSLMGRLLTATEVRSAQRYWHVLHGDTPSKTIYPKQYKPAVVGMVWQTMVQAQTWFGSALFLVYGIQLMPLTSISERRDDIDWLRQVYFPFSESCESDKTCTDQGWSILQFAVLAAVGHRELAAKRAVDLPKDVFDSAGGNGHSLSNTLWYISTRPDVEPLRLEHVESVVEEEKIVVEEPPKPMPSKISCECKHTCKKEALGRDAGGYTCRERITWLMNAFGKSEVAACRQVGGREYMKECGSCDPDRCAHVTPEEPETKEDHETDQVCPPCTSDVCQGDINRCPKSLLAPFLCASGANQGGCSQIPWSEKYCTDCCRVTKECFE